MSNTASFTNLMAISIVAALCGIVFLVGVFVIAAEGLGAKLPAWARPALGIANLFAALWWVVAAFLFEGIFGVSAAVQGLLGLFALLLSRRS